jgi:hypothetical protein
MFTGGALDAEASDSDASLGQGGFDGVGCVGTADGPARREAIGSA